MPSPSRAFGPVFCVALFLFPHLLFAQIPNVTDTTATPAPGMHDYLGSPTETVNPANGSLSVRLPVPIAPGRQLTLPFSFAYDSNGAFYIGQPAPGGGVPRYMPTPAVIGSKAGWSFAYPLLSFSGGTWTIPGSLDHLITCHGSTTYIFQDPNGNRHNLGLSVSPNVASPDGFDNCNGGLQGDGEFTTGGEGPILATTSIPGVNTGTFPSVTVVDGDGTGYFLPGGNPSTTGITTLATSVVDRNGNTITITNSSGAVTYTDTLGRAALSTSGMGGNPDSVTVGGLTTPYHVYWTTASASFTDNMLNLEPGVLQACPTAMSGSSSVVSSVVLPNLQQFTFTYDPTYGMLTKMVYPSGGYVRYVWGLNPQTEAGSFPPNWACRYDFPAVTDRYVSYNGSTEVLHQHFSYSTNWPNNTSFTWNFKTTTVTTTDLVRSTSSTTVYTYSPLSTDFVPNCGACVMTHQVPVEQTIQYNDTNGSLLETVSKTWQNIRLIKTLKSALANGQTSQTSWNYDANEMQTEQDEYDFGTNAPGPFLRATVTNYQPFSTVHLVDKPSSVVVYSDAAKTNRVAETDFTYDSPAGTVTSGIVSHSGSCNCGNVTKQAQWVNSSGTALSTNFTNDDTGQRLSMTDPKGNQTTYSHADSFSSGTPPGPTNAYLTTITYPTTGVAHTEKSTYAYATGEVTSSTDQNSLVTTYKYVDGLARLTEIDYPTPDGGITTKTYTDTPLAVSVETKNEINSGSWTDSFVLYDGLMHPIATSSANGEATPWDRVDTCYDGRALAKFTSYPYQISGATTPPNCASGIGDTFTYDALGRSTQVSHSDGNSILNAYVGRATQSQDEGNGTRRVMRVSQIDGLGRLLSVCEVSSVTLPVGSAAAPSACGQDIAQTGFLTTYTYDTLGNLKTVAQPSLNSRSFSYDFLSRLISAANPESGTTIYNYDSDTSCSSPNSFAADLVSRVDARGIRTCMQYDALHRLTQKNYSDGTPTANFMYDQASAYGATLTNTNGRMSSETTASPNPTAKIFGYDQRGRVKNNSQCTPQNCGANTAFPVNYTYDLLGDTLSGSNGEGVTISYSYNAAPRLNTVTSSFVDANHPATLFSALHYNAAGALVSGNLGNGLSETRTYDGRLRLASVSNGSIYNLVIPATGGYAPNSDILVANDNVNGNWTYAYDDFNRLLSANATAKAYTYDYDRYGNRWHQNGPHSSQLSLDANNHITGATGVGYDSAGNTTGDGSTTYTYDAEGRISSSSNSTNGLWCDTYNAEGQRVRKTNVTQGTCAAPTQSSAWDFLYDLSGHEIAMISGTGVWDRGEVYADGRRVATYNNGTTYFILTDQLGTDRVRTTVSGTVYQTCNNLPFGDWFGCPGSDATPMHFTGKNHLYESGLDDFGARYLTDVMGRFMSPDPDNAGASAGDPQSWNAYAYVDDNPINRADPTGLGPCDSDTTVCVYADADTFSTINSLLSDRLINAIGDAAHRTRYFLNTAWDWYRTSRLDPGCLAAATASGAAFGASKGPVLGGLLGLAGGPGAEVSVPGGMALGTLLGGATGGAAGNLIGQIACRTGGAGGGGGGGGGNGKGSGRTSPNQMNQQVQKGQAPNSVDRVDSPRFPNEQPHIEFKDGSALNIDGTWKHGGRELTNVESSWISSNGWSLPR